MAFSWATSLGVGLWLAQAGIALPPAPPPTPPQTQPVPTVSPLQRSDPPMVDPDTGLWTRDTWLGDRVELLQAIRHSLHYIDTPPAFQAYQREFAPGITREKVRESLLRFYQLVRFAESPDQLQEAIRREFVFYRSSGDRVTGEVTFTAYFSPTYSASAVPTAEYRYPIYRKPANFDQWSKPHPTRAQLEGEDGLGTTSLLKGQELAWFRDRIEAYLVQIQGSAGLQMTDGTTLNIGFGGATDAPYTSIGKELIQDGKIAADQLSLPMVIDYLKKHPNEANTYMNRNQRVVFFQPTPTSAAMGNLGRPVTAGRSIATDQSLMPPGAIALIHTRLPYRFSDGQLDKVSVSRYVLNQDTGSAIKGAGRVDVFLGKGNEAGDRAGLVKETGDLYFLLLK